MSTTAQINANRTNSQLSTGPTSPAGLERSSQNAIRHGLTGRTVHLTAAEEEPYRQFHENLFLDLQPKGANEEYLVESLIDSRWRIAQISKIEAGLYALGELEYADKFTTSDQIRAYTFKQNQKEFDKLNRYQARLHRQAAADFKILQELQTLRKAAELRDFQECCSLAIAASQGPDPDSFQPSQFGFVWSQDEIIEKIMSAKQRSEATAAFPTSDILKLRDIPKAA